jgi:hypothetical protein
MGLPDSTTKYSAWKLFYQGESMKIQNPFLRKEMGFFEGEASRRNNQKNYNTILDSRTNRLMRGGILCHDFGTDQ